MMKRKANAARALANARAVLFLVAAMAQRVFQYEHQTQDAIMALDMAAFEYGRVAQRVLVGE